MGFAISPCPLTLLFLIFIFFTIYMSSCLCFVIIAIVVLLLLLFFLFFLLLLLLLSFFSDFLICLKSLSFDTWILQGLGLEKINHDWYHISIIRWEVILFIIELKKRKIRIIFASWWGIDKNVCPSATKRWYFENFTLFHAPKMSYFSVIFKIWVLLECRVENNHHYPLHMKEHRNRFY